MLELDRDPEVLRWVDPFGDVTPAHDAHYLRWARRFVRDGFYAAEEQASGRFVGWFHLKPAGAHGVYELGYRLRRDAWGRGYATEGSRALIAAAWKLGVTRVEARALRENRASWRVMEKCGMAFSRAGDYRGLPEVVYSIERSSATA